MAVNQPFYLDEHIDGAERPVGQSQSSTRKTEDFNGFNNMCRLVKQAFKEDLEQDMSTEDVLTQRNAIVGHIKEVSFYKAQITEYLKKNKWMNAWHPPWYEDLVSAVFHENWGWAGIAAWKEMMNSSSCKIIGERIYFLMDGKQVLQEQTITYPRLRQLITALMLPTPEQRLDEDKAETYMLDGTRVKIFDDGLAKEPTIIFRKYIVDQFSFEEQAARGTIPKQMIPMLKDMTAIGFNVGFVGAVRTGKTTFLQTWQSYEDDSLEGIQVETDPEIPLHRMMPKAPIVQIVADGERLSSITKDLLRGDGDYLIMAEARDAIALKTALQSTAKGTRRVKITYHTSDPTDFCYDVASEIVQEFGGNVAAYAIKVAKGFHYLFEFVQLKDKSQKRLKGIYELRYHPSTHEITIHQICRYDFSSNNWAYKYDVGEDKKRIAEQEDQDAFERFCRRLQHLEASCPIMEEHVITLPYMEFLKG